jgi:DNA-binding transcriptional MerR regulator
VKPYVLRYWETEFRSLRPQKTRSQQRLYRRKEIELLLKIRHLLYEQRFTIEGARQRLRELGHDEGAAPQVPAPEIDREALKKIKQGLLDLLRMVED